MKKSIVSMIAILIALFGMHYAVRDALALDAPHNTNNQTWSITCSRCHYDSTSTPTWATLPTTTDATFLNNLCTDCHSASGMPTADPRYTDVKTHSATETASSYWSGNWTVECRVCHSPHYQQQATNPTFNAQPGVNMITGTSTAIVTSTSSTITSLYSDTANFPANAYIGALLVPNTAYPARVYRIRSHTTQTIFVDGAINPVYAKPGQTFGIRYGKMVNANMRTPYSGTRQVKFFGETGVNSFGTGVDATTTAVCQVCHTQTTSFNSSGSQEAGAHPTGVAGVQPCTDCHSHATGFKAGGCTNCHGSPPVDSSTLVFKNKDGNPVSSQSPGAGAHLKHTASAGLGCDKCHNNGMTSAATGDFRINLDFKLGATRVGGIYDATSRITYTVTGNATAPSTTVTTGGTLRCTNLYCHSSGQSATGASATPVYPATPPTWTNAASGACGTCHGKTSATLTTGNHAQHLAATTLVAGCGDCHSGAANDGSSYVSGNHLNKLIDVSNNYNMGGTPGNGYGSCVVASCHGSGTPNWGTTTTGRDKCTLCHGTPTNGTLASSAATSIAPPFDTARSSTGSTVGAHQAHLRTSTIARAIRCNECHVVPTAIDSAGHIKDATPGVAEVPFTIATSTLSRTGGASPSYAGGTCSSVYCHGSNMPRGTTEGADTTPSWGDTNYINGTASHDCGQCHGYPPAAIVAHGSAVPTNCVSCHDNVNPTGTGFANVSLHINGNMEVSGCNGCHGQSGPSGAPLILADLVSPATHASQPNAGSHDKHVTTSYGWNYTCSTCHSGHTMPTLDSVITMSFSGNATGGSYDGKTLTATYTYNAGVTQTTNTTMNCTVYCHSSGQSLTNGSSATPVYANPNWEITSTGACGTCHAATKASVSAANSGSHAKHVNAATVGGCSVCHTGAADDGSSYASASHINKLIDVASGVTYTNNGAPGNGYATCTTACHSTSLTSVGTPTWGNTATCASCHPTVPTTGSHTSHLAATGVVTGCNVCHTGAVQGSNGGTAHLDGNIDVINGYPTNVAKHAVGTYTGNCTTTCHSTSLTSIATPTWGQNDTCSTCHPTAPTTGSHSDHLAVSGVNCGSCHNGAVQGTNAGTNHFDGNIDVTNGYPANVAKHAAGSGYSSCSTASCHGSQSIAWGPSTNFNTCTTCHGTKTAGTVDGTNRYLAAPPVSVASNTGTLTGTGLVSNDAKVGAHQAHLRLLNTAASTTFQTIDERCQNCHGSTPISSMTATHANGSSAPVFSSLATRTGAMSAAYVGTTCNNTYCHNPSGTGGLLNATSAGTGTAPVWTNAGYIADGALKTLANCGVCHKVPESPVNPLWNYSTTHASYTIASDCSGCHTHNGTGNTHIDGVRQAAGSCDGCHGYGPSATDGKPERSIEGKGAHAKHVQHLVARWGGTLNPTTDAFGSGASWTNVCGVCHNGATHNMSEVIGGTGRTISIPTTFQFGTSAPVYNGTVGIGSASDPKTCSNVSCHFKATPTWSVY